MRSLQLPACSSALQTLDSSDPTCAWTKCLWIMHYIYVAFNKAELLLSVLQGLSCCVWEKDCVCVCQLHTRFCRHSCTLLESPGCWHARRHRDKTRPVLKSKSATYRMRSPRMARSVGLGGTANQLWSREHTEAAGWLWPWKDHDVVVRPESLAKYLDAFREQPGALMFASRNGSEPEAEKRKPNIIDWKEGLILIELPYCLKCCGLGLRLAMKVHDCCHKC